MIRIDHVTFSYGEENESAGGVQDINLNIEDGQFIVLCGESGCGKTTITRLINGLIPHYYEGKMNGEVWVNGAKVSEQPLYDTAKTVGSVFQNPRSQFFNVDTTSEITFGCENLGQPEQSIRERLEKTVRDFRLEKLMGRNIFHLSGGEKQKIACAGVSIMEPEVLVMILSRLVDTFFSRISLTMQPPPKPHSTACVLPWEEGRHWQSRSSGCSSS